MQTWKQHLKQYRIECERFKIPNSFGIRTIAITREFNYPKKANF